MASLLLVFFLMIRRPPRSTLDRSSAASDVYKRQLLKAGTEHTFLITVRENISEMLGFQFCIKFDAETVSYTHLRAHETVLDIVCRLLLEQNTTP